MRQLIGAGLLLALAACSPAPEPRPAPAPLRAAHGWISSAVLFDPARFAGRWYVAESAVRGCAGAHQDWVWDGRGYALSGIDCSGTRPAYLGGRLWMTGPGARFTPEGAFGGAPVWVLWVDQDYRTAVIGSPSGQFAAVLTRELPPRGDLMVAARRVLDFNSYDIRRIGR